MSSKADSCLVLKLLFEREKTRSAAADKGLTSNTNLNAYTHFSKELFSSFAFHQSRYTIICNNSSCAKWRQPSCLFFLIAQASLFSPKIAEQFMPGPSEMHPPTLRNSNDHLSLDGIIEGLQRGEEYFIFNIMF